jgi:hypothetical protein
MPDPTPVQRQVPCGCPHDEGPEVGGYVVALCHERGIHDPARILPLVSQAREDALGLCEQIVNEALGTKP